jgi:Zn-finger nucleic acid-binding protein
MGFDVGLMVISYNRRYRSHLLEEMEEEDKKKIEDLLPGEKVKILHDIKEEKKKKLKQSTRKCPECNRYFSIITIQGVELDACLFCNSLWFDENELKQMTNLAEDIPGKDLKSRKSKYKCPVCGEDMTEFVFIRHNNLLIDGCKDKHGVYLESGELQRALVLSE